MFEIRARNVNVAFAQGVRMLHQGYGELQESRNGSTHEFIEPVATVYESPQERVLFSPARDANPFFHLFEALWMLAGRNDVKFPASLVKRMADYSDDGVRAQGAYGYRWRKAFYMDQVAFIVEHLKKKPDSRRAVLAMWDPGLDVLGCADPKVGRTVGGIDSKDIPCNTHAYFKIRNDKLNMTVCCRSNDMLWGAYGANVVHFSMLQEYIAGKLGRPVGVYTQVSDSLHVYTGGPGGEVWNRVSSSAGNSVSDAYMRGEVKYQPMECDEQWDEDLSIFFKTWDKGEDPATQLYNTKWFNGVAAPLWAAYRDRAVVAAEQCTAGDWRKAAAEWLKRHPKKEE